MRTVILAAAVAVLPCASKAAAPPAASPPGLAIVSMLQTRPEQSGDRYSYAAETTSQTTRGGVTRDAAERQQFTLEILSVDKNGMVVRFTQTAAEETPSDGDQANALLLQAWNGVPVDFRTAPNGYPSEVIDEGKVKSELQARFAALSPNAAAIVPSLKQWLDGLASADFMKLTGDKLTALAAMQARGLVAIGHNDLPDEIHKDANGGEVRVKATRDVSLAPDAPCSLLIHRSTWTERPGAFSAISSTLDTQATVAEGDGWVISLTETDKTVLPAAQQTRTLKIVRQGVQGCARPK
jgi:hypothetical protein